MFIESLLVSVVLSPSPISIQYIGILHQCTLPPLHSQMQPAPAGGGGGVEKLQLPNVTWLIGCRQPCSPHPPRPPPHQHTLIHLWPVLQMFVFSPTHKFDN